MKKIYLAHPISGLSGEEVFLYYDNVKKILSHYFEVLHPMTGKDYLRTEVKYAPKGYPFPMSTDKAIVGRDKWMVSQADIVYINLLGSERVSIGSCFELAWASTFGKLTVLAIEEGNIHEHAFVIQSAAIVFDNHDSAISNILMLA